MRFARWIRSIMPFVTCLSGPVTSSSNGSHVGRCCVRGSRDKWSRLARREVLGKVCSFSAKQCGNPSTLNKSSPYIFFSRSAASVLFCSCYCCLFDVFDSVCFVYSMKFTLIIALPMKEVAAFCYSCCLVFFLFLFFHQFCF